MRSWRLPNNVALGAAICVMAACSHAGAGTQTGKQARSSPASAEAGVLPRASTQVLTHDGKVVAVADVVQRVLPSVVSVSSKKSVQLSSSPQPFDDPFFRRFFRWLPEPSPSPHLEQGLGSGVVVRGDVILTNNHVIDGATEIEVTTHDNRVLKAKLVGSDPKTDLAVLRVQTEGKPLQPIQFGDSSRLRLGDTVLAIGNPFGVGQTVTMGIVSAKGRADLGIVDYENFIQTDAAINPGNSGGALVDTAGTLVGINTAILSRSGGYMGIGFAIPTNMAKPILESLLTHGKVVRGWLGVSIQNLTPELAEAMDLEKPGGVLIADVQDDTPAARAGLRRGDVVRKINGQPVGTVGDMRNQIATAGAGAKVALEIERNGKPQTLTVTLAELPETQVVAAAPGGAPSEGGSSLDGLSVTELTPELKRRYDVSGSVQSGVVITEVAPDSEGARVGLRPGDVVLEVNRHEVTNVAEFAKAWKQAGKQLLLLVHRRGATLFLALKRSG
jgi:serine protease Do